MGQGFIVVDIGSLVTKELVFKTNWIPFLIPITISLFEGRNGEIYRKGSL